MVDYIAMALLLIGGLNWASVALVNVDLVASLFGAQSPATKLVYLLVGIAALYSIYLTSRWATRPRLHPKRVPRRAIGPARRSARAMRALCYLEPD